MDAVKSDKWHVRLTEASRRVWKHNKKVNDSVSGEGEQTDKQCEREEDRREKKTGRPKKGSSAINTWHTRVTTSTQTTASICFALLFLLACLSSEISSMMVILRKTNCRVWIVHTTAVYCFMVPLHILDRFNVQWYFNDYFIVCCVCECCDLSALTGCNVRWLQWQWDFYHWMPMKDCPLLSSKFHRTI